MTTTDSALAWRPLTRSDLTTFDDVMTDIVLEYTSLGWLGKMSSAGHALLRSSDGEAMTTVSRASNRGRSGTKARADLDRWKNSRPGAALGVPAVPTPLYFESAEEREVYTKYSSHPDVQKHLESLVLSGLQPLEIVQRIQVMATEGEPEGWYVMDVLERRVIAHGSGISEAEAYEIHFNPDSVESNGKDLLPFKCTVCGRGFESKRSRGSHYRGHTMSASCPDCDYSGTKLERHQQKALHGAHSASQTPAGVTTPEKVESPSDGLTGALDSDLGYLSETARRASETILELRVKVEELSKALADANAKISLITEALGE